MPFRLHSCISLIVLLISFSQVRILHAQSSATGIIEHDKITAGQKFHVKVHLAETPTFSTSMWQYFIYKQMPGLVAPQNPVQIYCNGPVTAGNKDVVLECSIPNDADGGTYTSTLSPFYLGPRPGGSRQTILKLTVPDFEVIPLPDNNVYPTKAVAVIQLDQQQILENGAAKIEALLDQLNTTTDDNSAETPALKRYLTTVAREGQTQLEQSRSEYRQTLQAGSTEPIFFEDFARRYTALIVELRAPQSAVNRVDLNLDSKAPHLIRVQLSSNDTITVHPQPLNGSIGPLLSQLAELLGDHMAAFLQISKNNSTSFTISLRSTPPGASVSYKRIGEAYQDYSALTDIPQATFPYAKWTFRFRMGNCEVVKTPNPYIEKSPNLDPSMQNCQKK